MWIVECFVSYGKNSDIAIVETLSYNKIAQIILVLIVYWMWFLSTIKICLVHAGLGEVTYQEGEESQMNEPWVRENLFEWTPSSVILLNCFYVFYFRDDGGRVVNATDMTEVMKGRECLF